MTTAPYGSWPTPFTSELVVADAVRLGELAVDGDAVVWAEGRPSEGGRTQLVRRGADGLCVDLLPEGFNASAGGRLGLQIVRTLVSAELDATLQMQDAPEGGTDVVLRVPIGRRARALL